MPVAVSPYSRNMVIVMSKYKAYNDVRKFEMNKTLQNHSKNNLSFCIEYTYVVYIPKDIMISFTSSCQIMKHKSLFVLVWNGGQCIKF